MDASPGKDTILFGGSGFLGQQILQECPDVISVGRTAPPTYNRHIHVDSLADLEALRPVPFDKVIYTIGHSDTRNLSREDVRQGQPTAFDYHVTPLLQTMEQLKGRAINKFIHMSTCLIYDEKKIKLPVSEQSPTDPYKDRYVLSKHLAEEACKFYSRWVPIINVRLANLYGPTRLKRFDLIYTLINQLLDKGKGQVWTTQPERDFIYVEDAADAIIKLLESDYTGTLNLGTGRATSVSDIVNILEEVSGCSIVDLGHPIQGLMRFQSDITTLRALIDWSPRYQPREGVKRTFEIMKSWREDDLER